MDRYEPYTYRGKPLLLERFLLLEEAPCGADAFDMFDSTLAVDCARAAMRAGAGEEDFPIFADVDREFYSVFRNCTAPETKRYRLYTRIDSDHRTEVLIHSFCPTRGKLWVNGQCLVVSADVFNSEYYLTVELQKGANHLVYEQVTPKATDVFSFQIRNRAFELGDDIRALSHTQGFHPDPLLCLHDPFYIPGDTFRLQCVVNHNREYAETYHIRVIDNVKGEVFVDREARLGEIVTLDVKAWREKPDGPFHHEWVALDFPKTNGETFSTGLAIVPFDIAPQGEALLEQLAVYAKELPLPLAEQVEAYSARQREEAKDLHLEAHFWTVMENRQRLLQIEEGRFQVDPFTAPGHHEYIYRSQLDGRFVRIGMRIPADYDTQRRYPLLLAFATHSEGWFCWNPIEQMVPEPCLAFDVSGRGFTGGSYIGEASIREILRWIRQRFRYDEDRVYIVGQSNGGFAGYAYAQNFPGQVAALFPLIGYPCMETIENLSNTPVYQMVSDLDHVFRGREQEVQHALGRFGNYHQTNLKGLTHFHMGAYGTHRGILAEMFRQRRDRWPAEVRFSTCRNRHVESFWLRLAGIGKGHRRARVHAAVTEEGRCIRIHLTGSRGIALTLPPYVNRRSFAIEINRCRLSFTDWTERTVTLVNEKGWHVAPALPAADVRKGTGLLDVYMGSLRVILPDHAPAPMRRTAESFAVPETNGYVTTLSVRYPVYEASEAPDYLYTHHLVVLDSDYTNPYAARCRDRLPVQYDAEGFTYRGERTTGPYVIMQVIANPYDADRSLLIVAANDLSLLRRHILLRKITLPTYINGLHPYWNNAVLVFHDGQYAAAFEAGDPLRPI